MFSVHTKTQSRRFQILLVWRAFSKSSVYSWRISVDGKLNRRNKTAFSNFSGVAAGVDVAQNERNQVNNWTENETKKLNIFLTHNLSFVLSSAQKLKL